MSLIKPPCSDTVTDLYPVLVLEGMPGAGKTTAATTLAAENRAVIGEYTTLTGDVIPIEGHPAVDDDAEHQRNWLHKHHQVQAARCHGPVFCDRDWLSALAYAYSVTDDELLTDRADWVSDCLDRRVLTLASTYVVFQLDPSVSLRRRADRLTPGHPWSSRPGLIRLATFYTDSAEALAPVHPNLAARLRTATWHSLRDCTLDRTVRFLRDLADHT
ncbi:MAG: AAA family ATPase [Pseudonocardia sp.]